jgi:hypothetical protein
MIVISLTVSLKHLNLHISLHYRKKGTELIIFFIIVFVALKFIFLSCIVSYKSIVKH